MRKRVGYTIKISFAIFGPKRAEMGLKFVIEKLEKGLDKGIKLDGQIIETGTRTRNQPS